MTSTSKQFEEILTRARQNLAKAREKYKSLEETRDVPDRIVESIAELERELDELDDEIDVTEDDVELAEQTGRRVSLLYEVLSALREQQGLIIEADLKRYRLWLDGVSRAIRKHGLDDVAESQNELERYCSTMEQLVESGRHERVVNNERFTLHTIDEKLRTVDSKLRNALEPTDYARVCLGVCESLLDEIHDALSELTEQNPARTGYASDLRAVKEHRNNAEEALNTNDSEYATLEARIALTGSQMLQYLVARSQSEQYVTERLATTIRRAELDVDCNVSDSEVQGDSEALLAAVAEAVGTEVELSKGARLRQLLSEHDEDVIRTANATDFDVPSILNHLEQMHRDNRIDEITVEFSQ